MSDEWMSAAEALKLAQSVMSFHAAPRAICIRAREGLIEATAVKLILRDRTVDDAKVPEEFWWAKGEAALEQNWATGDFSTWIDRRYHLRAYGVQFRRSDIMKMVSGNSASAVGNPQAGVDEEWINSRDARRFVYTVGRINPVRAGEAILEYCRIGHITGRAKHMKVSIKDRYQTRHEEESDCEIPDWFWEHCTESGASVQDWVAGMLSGKGYIDGETVTAKLVGVTFRRADLEVFRSQPDISEPPGEVAAPISKGGKPPAAWWDALWVEICRQLYVGDLKPKAQVDVETAMHDWLASIGESAAESTIRERARKLWDAISK